MNSIILFHKERLKYMKLHSTFSLFNKKYSLITRQIDYFIVKSHKVGFER